MNLRYPALYDDPTFRAAMLGIPYRPTWYAVTTTTLSPHAPRSQRHVVNSEALAVRLWHEGGGRDFRRLNMPESPV